MPTRVHLQHVPPHWVADGSWYFITVCARQRGENVLCQPDIAHALIDSAREFHRMHRWAVHLLLLMPDHLHAILGFSSEVRMAEEIRNWKRAAARLNGVAWQRNFFDHRIRPGESLDMKAAYIRENPVRAGLVKYGDDWPWRIDFRNL